MKCPHVKPVDVIVEVHCNSRFDTCLQENCLNCEYQSVIFRYTLVKS